MSLKILLIVAYRTFRDEEYLEPRQIFDQAGFNVTVASSKSGIAQGKLGAQVKVDITLDQVNVADYAAILFIGGGGCEEYFDNPFAHQIAQAAVKQGKVLGAICAAPEILARAGVLKGKKATMYTDNGSLAKGGAIYTGSEIEIDGQIITGRDAQASTAWGLAIQKALSIIL